MIEITFVPFEELNSGNLKLMYVLNKLSDATKSDENTYLVPREVDFYLKNLLCVVFAFDRENFVGAACVIRCLDNRTYEELWVGESRLVVELGSNYVHPDYRGNNIGRDFMTMRLDYCKHKNYFPVSVTSNKIVQNYFEQLGGVPMKEYSEYKDLCSRIRTCNCPKGQSYHNQDCDLLDKEVYMFE